MERLKWKQYIYSAMAINDVLQIHTIIISRVLLTSVT
jgi:hypothetical protein